MEEIIERISKLENERTELHDKISQVHKKYRDMAEQEYPSDIALEKSSSLSKEINQLYRELDKEDRDVVRKNRLERLRERAKVCPRDCVTDLSITKTDESSKELIHRLVQECINYILDVDDTDIDEVHFSVNGLRGSVPHGSWQACTDASIELYGLQYDKDIDSIVRERIGGCM